MMRTSRLTRVFLALVSLTGLVLLPGASARATFPGVDGRIAFSDYITGQVIGVNGGRNS